MCVKLGITRRPSLRYELVTEKKKIRENRYFKLLAQIEVSSAQNTAPKFEIVNVNNWLEGIGLENADYIL